jgi:hypothetical protein
LKTISKKTKPQWWRPIATRKWFVACLLLVLLILIALLEVIEQMSDNNYGIADFDSSDDYQVAASYVPVFVMLLVAAMYNTLNFTFSVFAPFSVLRRGNASAERSISTNLISKMPPCASYLSLRDRQWGNSFTISAALVSSFLTIAASGLYSPETIRASHIIQMRQMDSLNLSHIDFSQDDDLAGMTTKLAVL